jgi:5-methyltetrahydrofolate--homocysteine methyltransferase
MTKNSHGQPASVSGAKRADENERRISVDMLEQISARLIEGDEEAVAKLTHQALTQGLAPRAILDDALIAGMNVIGARFKNHEIFLPDVLLAARAMYAGLAPLKPLLEKEGGAARGTIVLGTVQGDLHDIGKNLVAIMLRGAGYEVIDLGHDVPPEKFVSTARAHRADVIGLSALLTTTMSAMRGVIERVQAEGLAGQVKVIVGGAPVSADFAREIGADAHGYDAANAVERVYTLIGRK